MYTIVSGSNQRKLNPHDTPLLRRVYRYLGLDAKSRDFEVHCQAMSAVRDTLAIEPITRWSRLTVAQIEQFLALQEMQIPMAA